MSDAGRQTGCNGHGELPAEFRTVVLGALDRINPVMERLQAQQRGVTPDVTGSDGAGPTAARSDHDGSAKVGAAGATSRPCAVCPVCAVIAAWRGERSELAARAVDQVTLLIAVLRAALDEGAGASSAPADESAARHRPLSERAVHHINVHR